MTQTQAIILGCIGGALPDIIRIIKSRFGEEVPGFIFRLNFWIGFILLIALGGFTAWLAAAQDLKQAVAYGFCAPEIISRLAGETSAKRSLEPDTKPGIRDWWSI